jgi:hypothetical protein
MGMQAERRPREKNWNTVVADDLRPAGNGKDCFYCGEPLGGQHEEGCVIRKCAGQYHVAIRKNETGEVRMYRHDMAWDDSSMYQWTDGNYGCDCNRELFWHRANGDEAEAISCGSTDFTVLYAELPDGTRIEIDDPPEPGQRS